MKKILFGLIACTLATSVMAQTTLTPVFQRVVGDGTTETWFDNNNLTRSGAVNTASTIVGGLSIIMPPRGDGDTIRVCDPTTGLAVHSLDMTGISGGTFAYNCVAVADDGKVYACNLQTGTTNVRVYEWADDAAATVPVLISDASATVSGRSGDTMTVATSIDGQERSVYVGGNNAAARIVKVSTTDGGTSWTTAEVGPTRAALGICASSPNGPIYLKVGSADIIGYDESGTETDNVTSGTLAATGSTTGLDYFRSGGHEYITLTSYAGGTQFAAQVLDITDLGTTVTIPYDTPLIPGTTINNSNGNGTSACDVAVVDGKALVFNVATNNIYALYELELNPEIIISQVVDATMPGGLPKAVELTNVTDAAVDLADYTIGSANNAYIDAETVALSGSLAAGESFVIASEAVESLNIFGQAPDLIDSLANINGDDTIVLHKLGFKVDVYGEIGTDGTGEAWEYLDSYAYRNSDACAPLPVMDISEWVIPGAATLDGLDAVALQAILDYQVPLTGVGSHTFDCGPSAVEGWTHY